MIKINLLPWRDALRIKRRKQFIMISILTVLLAALILIAVTYCYNQVLQNQLQANQFIIRSNQTLDRQLKSLDGLQAQRHQIIERMALIQSLQSKRPVVVRLMDEVVRTIPAPLFLTKFTRKDDRFIFEGRADNPNTVAEFLRNLEQSPWYRNAFMNSFLARDVAQQGQSAVIPSAEAGFGDFVVTVEVTEPAEVFTDVTPDGDTFDQNLAISEVNL